MNAAIDLTKNENQKAYFNAVMSTIAGVSDKRIFNYGGAIRGGKTFVSLFIFMVLCKKFPRSRWHVIREDMPALKTTSIPSLEKLIGSSPNWRWNRDSSNYYVEYSNGSRIFFKGENITSDPELNDFLGLETNGILLEQIEELSKKLLNISLSRTGSWYIEPMPPAIIMTTFNPNQTWVKEDIHEPHLKGTLPAKWHYQSALPKDNPFVTEDQWGAWEMMDERYQKQFIEGDWTNFDDGDNRWLFAFSRQKHVQKGIYATLDRTLPVWLSWDFNRNPLCCGVLQHNKAKKQIRVIKAFKVPNTGADELCDMVMAEFPNCLWMVTGDYSGHNAQSILKEQITHYKIIKQKMRLVDTQLRVQKQPELNKNRTLMNMIFHHYDVLMDEDHCKPLIFDCENVRARADGTILKKDRDDPAEQADSIDWLRYFCNVDLKDFEKYFLPS